MNSKIDRSNQKIVLFLYFYSFFAGMGIEMPLVHFAGNFGIGDFFLLAALGLQIFYRKSLRIHWLSFCLFIFGCVSLVSYANSLFIDGLNTSPVGYIFRFFFYSVVVSLFIMTTKTLDILFNHLKCLAYGASIFLFSSWHFFFTEPGILYYGIPTLAYLDNVNANTQAFYYTLIVPILIFLLFSGRINKKIGIFITFLFIFSAFATLSKVGWGGLILSSLFLVYVLIIFKKRTTLSVLCIGFVLFAVNKYDFLFDIINKRLTSSGGSNNDRLELILNGFEIWSHYPIFGSGPKTFIYRSAEYGSFPVIARDAHNTWVNLLSDIGFLPVLLLAMIYLLAFVAAVNSKRKHSPNGFYRLQRKLTQYFFITMILLLFLWSNFTGLIYSDKIPWILLSLLFSYNKNLLYSNIEESKNYYYWSKKKKI